MFYPYEQYKYNYLYTENANLKSLLTNSDLIQNSQYEYVLLESLNPSNSNKYTSKGILFLDHASDAEKYKVFISDYLNKHSGYSSYSDLLTLDSHSKLTDLLSQFQLAQSQNLRISFCISKEIYTKIFNHLLKNKESLFNLSFYDENFINHEKLDNLPPSDLRSFQKFLASFFVNDCIIPLKTGGVEHKSVDYLKRFSDLIFPINRGEVNALTFSNPLISFHNYQISYLEEHFTHTYKSDFLRISDKNNIIAFKRLIENHFKFKNTPFINHNPSEYIQSLIVESQFDTTFNHIHDNFVTAIKELLSENLITKDDVKELKKDVLLQTLIITGRKDDIVDYFQILQDSEFYSDKEIATTFLSYVNNIHKKKNANKKNLVNKDAVMNLVLEIFTPAQIDILKNLNSKQKTLSSDLSILLEKFQQHDPQDYLSGLASSSDIFLNDFDTHIILLEFDPNKLLKLFPTNFNNLAQAYLGTFAKTFDFTYVSNSTSSKSSQSIDRFIFKSQTNELNIDQKFIRESLIRFMNSFVDEFNKRNMNTASIAQDFISKFAHQEFLQRKLSLSPVEKDNFAPHIKKKI